MTKNIICLADRARKTLLWSSEAAPLAAHMNAALTITVSQHASTHIALHKKSNGINGDATMNTIWREEAAALADALRPVDRERAGEPEGALFARGTLHLMPLR
jgi:hypothetical protein